MKSGYQGTLIHWVYRIVVVKSSRKVYVTLIINLVKSIVDHGTRTAAHP